MTRPNTLLQNHQPSLKRSNTHQRFLPLTDIHPHFYERSQRQKDQQSMKNPRIISNLPQFYSTLKVSTRFFAAAYKNKAFSLSLNLIRRRRSHLCYRKTSAGNRRGTMLFTKFSVNVTNYTSEKQGERLPRPQSLARDYFGNI